MAETEATLNARLRGMSARWNALPVARRVGLVLVVAIVGAGLFFLVYAVGKEKYVPLFTQLEPAEAGAVVEKLKELRVPYQLTDEGETILVPEDKVHELRLELANTGVLAGKGVGFELFDQTPLGMTETQWRVNYQRALQEELRRTITQYEEVKDARVHLVIPEPTVFVREKGEPSAAVVVALKPLATLNPEQVKSIMYLVASSVEGMKPENVRVMDTAGNLLSEGVALAAGPASALSQHQQELKRNFEKDLEKRLEGALERVLGPGNAVVMVSANLDFNQQEVTRLDFDDRGVVRSEQVVEEEGRGPGGAQGPVGELNRQPTTYEVTTGGGEGSYRKTETTRNYEVGQTQTKTVYAPGRLLNLSTAVAVNGPLAPDTVEQVRQIVAAGTSYRPERGDQIMVTSLAFNRSYVEEMAAQMAAAEEEAKRRGQLKQYVTWGLTGLAILLAFILILVLLRRRPAPLVPEMAPAVEEYFPFEEIKPAPPPLLDQEAKARQDRAREVVRQRPEEAAQLVKTWLGEE